MLGKHSFKGTNGSHRAQHNDATVLCGRHSRPTQSLPTAEMEEACLIANKPRLNYVQIQFRKCQLLLFSPQFPVLQAAVQKHKDYNLTQSMYKPGTGPEGSSRFRLPQYETIGT